MHAVFLAENWFEVGGSQFAARTGNRDDFGSAGKKLRRAALVGVNVGKVMAQDRLIAAAKVREGKGVGGGSVEDKKYFALALEHVVEELFGACRPCVAAVGRGAAGIGGGERGPRFGRDARRVVAGEVVVVLWGGGRRRHGRSVQFSTPVEQTEVPLAPAGGTLAARGRVNCRLGH